MYCLNFLFELQITIQISGQIIVLLVYLTRTFYYKIRFKALIVACKNSFKIKQNFKIFNKKFDIREPGSY